MNEMACRVTAKNPPNPTYETKQIRSLNDRARGACGLARDIAGNVMAAFRQMRTGNA